MVSVYSADKPFPVYHHQEWASDDWDATDYGRDYDFSRGFFEQFHELQQVVPRRSIHLIECEENCEYNNNLWRSKNTYLTFMSSECVDSYYNYASYAIRDCMDVWYSKDIELSYRVALGGKLYRCFFCERCDNSNDLYFCTRLRGCSSCFGCYGLTQKKYCIYNEQVTPEVYARFIADQKLGSFEGLRKAQNDVRKFFSTLPKEAVVIDDFSEDCTGNFIDRSKGCEECFGIVLVEDSMCLLESARVKDSLDLDFSYDMTFCYNANAAVGCNQSAFLDNCLTCHDLFYASLCQNTNSSFGCIGLQRKSHCLLNKQYSPEEFFALRSRVIEDMRARGEWGQFFPMQYSDFGYNETDGAILAPLSEEEAKALGARWVTLPLQATLKDREAEDVASIPDDIRDVDDSICKKAFRCPETGKIFSFIPEEIALSKRQGIALPRVHPSARYLELIGTRGPLYVKEVACTKCGVTTETAYPDDSRKVVCRPCFLEWKAGLSG